MIIKAASVAVVRLTPHIQQITQTDAKKPNTQKPPTVGALHSAERREFTGLPTSPPEQDTPQQHGRQRKACGHQQGRGECLQRHFGDDIGRAPDNIDANQNNTSTRLIHRIYKKLR